MAIAMTEQQRRDFDEKGYVVLDDFLSPSELDRLLGAIDEVGARIRAAKGLGPDQPFAVWNALAKHDAFLDLVDHPRMLPLIVDAIGWNIQVRITHLDVRPPYPTGLVPGALGTGRGDDARAGYNSLQWHQDLSRPHQFERVSLDGRLPFLELKVGYYLSDLTEHNSGAIALVPASYTRPAHVLRDQDYQVNPAEVVELNVRAGTAMLWRNTTWHCVTPNLSNRVRKVMYVGYNYRWIRPDDYVQQDPDLIARSTPIRRQLLGALATGSDPLGNDPYWGPRVQHWHVFNWDDVPLKAWAEEREQAARQSAANANEPAPDTPSAQPSATDRAANPAL